ncbi:unnamed protein product, partial [Didymodactylos carnosus]
ETMNDIKKFEKRVLTHSDFEDEGFDEQTNSESINLADIEVSAPYEQENAPKPSTDITEYIHSKTTSGIDPYIMEIRRRLQEDIHARREREKRRRKVLVDQLRALESIEDARREESLVSHLLRQSQFERRLAVELLQTRHEKDVLRQNRIGHEKELEQRRRLDFIEAMDREAELARLARIEYAEQVRKDKELHDIIASDKAEAQHQENFQVCTEITWQLVDFSLKVSEYRQLCENLIPVKLWREWNALFIAGQSLFDDENRADQQDKPNKLHAQTILEEESLKLLDEGDFNEYRNMIGEWEPPTREQFPFETPPVDNPIYGFVINRLHHIVHPPPEKLPPPLFPAYGLKIIVLGKSFSGKTTALKRYCEEHTIVIISLENLVHEAIDAFKNNEMREGEADSDSESSVILDEDKKPDENTSGNQT